MSVLDEDELQVPVPGPSTTGFAEIPEKRPISASDFTKVLFFFNDKHTADLASRQITAIEQLLRKYPQGFVSLRSLINY